MSEYGKYMTYQKPTPLLSSDPVQEKKAARRKLLDVIYQDKSTVSQKTCHAAKRFQRMGFLS